MRKEIIVGFSVNPEIAIEYNGDSKELKIPLEGIGYRLGGSGYNVTRALNQLGVEARLLGLCGSNPDDPSKVVLEHSLKKEHIPHTLFPILNRQSVAILPLDGKTSKVIGRRGQPIAGKVAAICAEIASLPKPFYRLAVGVTSGELPLAQKLFDRVDTKSHSVNVLTPNMRLLQDTQLSNDDLDALLSQTTILVMSDYEYEALLLRDRHQYAFARLHIDFAIRIIIVTRNCHGGTISVDDTEFNYSAFTPENFVSEVGAGDWFLAAFMSKFAQLRTVDRYDTDAIKQCVRFASVLAGIKTGYPGGANGPTPDQIIDFADEFRKIKIT